MRRTKNQVSGDQGELLFQRLLPPGWVARKDVPDFGFDFFVEVFQDEVSTGRRFAVQIKSSVRGASQPPRHPFPTKRLAWIAESCKDWPVLIVYADLAGERCYWVHAQRYVREQRLAVNSGVHKVTMRYPEHQQVGANPAFERGVREAFRDQDAQYLPETLAAEVRRVEALDSRFRVSLSASSDGQRRYELHAKQPVVVGLALTLSRERALAFQDTLECGGQFSFDATEFKVGGMPILEASRGPLDRLELAIGETWDATFALTPEHGDPYFIPVSCTNGRTFVTVKPKDPGAFIQLDLKLPKGAATGATARVQFNSPAFLSTSVKRLPPLTKPRALFDALSSGGRVSVGVLDAPDVRPLGVLRLDADDATSLDVVDRLLGLLCDLQLVCSKFDCDADTAMARDITQAEAEDVRNAARWLRDESIIIEPTPANPVITLEPPVENIPNSGERGDFLIRGSKDVTWGGIRLGEVRIEHRITGYEFEYEDLRLRLRASPEARWVIRRAAPVEPAGAPVAA